MKLDLPGTPHLTYCTNIHPGESWSEVRANLERYTTAVKQKVSPDRSFGLGLRLSARAAERLAQPEEIAAFQEFMAAHDLYMFTFNGFPYGPFHGEPVKEEVYLPDWTDEARLAYTNQLADILAALLPQENDALGTISTVPGAFRERIHTEAEIEAMAMMIARHAAHLFRVRERTGRRIALALEPEPCCYLELTGETVDFLRDQVWRGTALATFGSLTGLRGDAAEQFLRDHVGVCFDTCHMAVEYEHCGSAIRSFQQAGVRILKAQVTAGLEVAFDGSARDAETLAALASFAEGVYLHQVVERRGGQVRRYLDLPEALAGWQSDGVPDDCRIHFHVPVFKSDFGPFGGTQSYVGEFLEMIRHEPITPHLELETYTWDVLPPAHRRESIVDAIAGELQWALDRVRG